jgi:glycosyltransferase involved in cell wall biosynthesis
MIDVRTYRSGPLVSLIICTHNRRAYLPEALRCAVAQTYRNLQIIVVRDGGEQVADVLAAFDDPRILFLDRDENRGYAASLNEALAHAQGAYVAYLGDDDIHYPDHIAALVHALEDHPECGAAYADLFKTFYRVGPDGRRRALGKILEIRRDFERIFMFHFNQVLGGSFLHRRELLDKAGGYNEDRQVLIDWDMTRRLAFYTDFCHVRRVTGEYCLQPGPQHRDERISSRVRRDPATYQRNVQAIRATRPPKPWDRALDLSILYTPARLSQAVVNTLQEMYKRTFVPNLVYLTLPPEDLARLDGREMPSLVPVPVPRGAPPAARVDAALQRCEGDLAALVPEGVRVGDMWIEDPYHALCHSEQPKEALLLAQARHGAWSVVARRDELAEARRRHAVLDVRASLQHAGFTVRPPRSEELPFRFDSMLHVTERLESDGDWKRSARIFEEMRRIGGHDLWMKQEIARSLCEAGRTDPDVMDLYTELNERLPTPETLLAEARMHRKADRLDEAVTRLEQAREMLTWKA